MLLVARNPSFKFACQRTNKRKKENGEEENAERKGLHRFKNESPREKVNGKKGGEKEEQESEARPNPMKTLWVIVNSSTRQSTPWSADDGGDKRGTTEMAEGVWKGWQRGNWRHCAWVVHYDSVDSPIRCVAFTTESSCQSAWKVRPVTNCDLSPRKNSSISVDSARKRGKAWCGIGCKRIRHLCDSYRDKSVSLDLGGDGMQKWNEFIQFHAQRNINRIDRFEKGISQETMIAKFENVCCFPNNFFFFIHVKRKYIYM